MFRMEMNKEGGSPIFGRGGAVFRLEMKKGGLPVPGEAPLVYYIVLFGAKLGCLPSGDE